MTDAEIAQIVRDEWARPMIRINKADADAFDYFASQEQRKTSLVTTYVVCVLVSLAMVMFIGALTITLAGVFIAWALWFALSACVLLFIATLLGTFGK